MNERFPLVRSAEMTPLQRGVNDEICAGPRGSLIGPFQVLLHAPELARRIHPLGEYLRFECSLPKDVIELMVLFTASRWKSHFEWAVHSEIGRRHGLSEATLDALHAGLRPAGMSGPQAAAWAVAADVHRSGEASDESFDMAVRIFGRQGVLELITLCGYYTTLAMILNTARFLPERGLCWLAASPAQRAD